MTTVAWALLVIGCSAWMYRTGYASGAEAARQLGRLAVEQERIRCRELRMTQVFGPRAEKVTRRTVAECN